MTLSRREFVFSAGALFVTGAFGTTFKSNRKFVIAHISDVHISDKGNTHDILKVVEDINGDKAIDFVVVTGDLQNRGQLDEMFVAKSWYDLIEKPKAVCPGNHEMQYPGSRENWKKTFGEVSGKWCFNGIPVYSVDSTPPGYVTSGFFRQDDMVHLTQNLVKDNAKNASFVVFLTHYSPTLELANWWLLPQAIKKAGVENALILSGHIHQFLAYNWQGYLGFAGRSLAVNKRKRNRPGVGYTKLTVEADGCVIAEERIVGTKVNQSEWKVALACGANGKRKDVSSPKAMIVPAPVDAFNIEETGVFRYPERPPQFTPEEVRFRKSLSKELAKRYRNFRISACCRTLSANGMLYVPGSRGQLVVLEEKTRDFIRMIECGYSPLLSVIKMESGISVSLAEGRSFTLKEK